MRARTLLKREGQVTVPGSGGRHRRPEPGVAVVVYDLNSVRGTRMRVRTAVIIATIAALDLVGCSSRPSEVGIEGQPPIADTGSNITPPQLPAPAPAGPADHFGDGTFEVLVDIKAGVYKTTGGPPGAPICYWARMKDTRGEITSLLASGYGNTGPDIVTITPSDKAFETRGCGVWRLQP